MKKLTSHFVAKLLLAAISFSAVGTALAADPAYPDKPIRLLVPYPAAGAADLLARTFAQKLSENLGQSIVIDNKGGANGIVGSDVVAKAAPDGYTLLLDNITFHAINASLYKKMPFNTVRDLVPVSLIGWVDNVLVVNPSLPVNSLKDLIALAKTKPGQLTYASSGSGSTSHLSGVMLDSAAGISMLHVPYKGGAPAMADVMGNSVTAYFAGLSTAQSMIKAGRLKPLAVAGAKRNAAFPELPTVAESGLPGFDASNWYALMVPRGTSQDIINKLNAETIRVLQNPDVIAKILSQGYEIKTSTPQFAADYLKSETTRWAEVVKTSGAQAD